MASCRILREKFFYPGPGLEPGPLAFCANALTSWAIGQVRVQDRIQYYFVKWSHHYFLSFNLHSSEYLPPWDIVTTQFVHPEVRKENLKRLILSWTCNYPG